MWEEDSLACVLGCQGLCLFLLFRDFLLTLVMWRAWQWPVAIGCSGLVWTGLVYLGEDLRWLCLGYPQSSVLTMEECYSSCVFVSTQDNCTLSSGQPWNRSTINVCACVDFAFFVVFWPCSYSTTFISICFVLFFFSHRSFTESQNLTPQTSSTGKEELLELDSARMWGPSCWRRRRRRREEGREKGRETRSSSCSNRTEATIPAVDASICTCALIKKES